MTAYRTCVDQRDQDSHSGQADELRSTVRLGLRRQLSQRQVCSAVCPGGMCPHPSRRRSECVANTTRRARRDTSTSARVTKPHDTRTLRPPGGMGARGVRSHTGPAIPRFSLAAYSAGAGGQEKLEHARHMPGPGSQVQCAVAVADHRTMARLAEGADYRPGPSAGHPGRPPAAKRRARPLLRPRLRPTSAPPCISQASRATARRTGTAGG